MDYGLDRKSTSLKTFNTIFIIVWLLIACFPFIWTFWGSFKVRADFFSRSDWWYAISAFNTLIETGGKFTTDAYTQAWTEGEFWKASKNTIIVTVFVVSISLFLGTLGAYALSRSTERYAFWILIAALIFRAMPHITLVSGYLFPFFQLQIWGILPTTIVVLVAINQPFTLWLLYSFFKTVPKELDESALILLNQENHTMVPKIQSYLGTNQHEGNLMWAVSAVVSATAPLFMLVMFFQRQVISGLTAGAVKG